MRQGGLILAAGRVRSKEKKIEKKNTKKSAAPKTHHEIHCSPTTATTSKPRATKHIPRVRPYSRFHRSRVCGNRPRTALAISKDDECYTYTHTQTYRQMK